jgi:hypothetical protein
MKKGRIVDDATLHTLALACLKRLAEGGLS